MRIPLQFVAATLAVVVVGGAVYLCPLVNRLVRGKRLIDHLTDGETYSVSDSQYQVYGLPHLEQLWIHRPFKEYIARLRQFQPDLKDVKNLAPPVYTRAVYDTSCSWKLDGGTMTSFTSHAAYIYIMPGKTDMDKTGRVIPNGDSDWTTVLTPDI